MPRIIEIGESASDDTVRTTAYLYWPVSLKGVTEEWTDDTLHITAKFLGEVFPGTLKEDPWKELAQQCDQALLKVSAKKPVVDASWEWKPVVFQTKNDGEVKVLEITKYPNLLNEVHDALEVIRKDDYPDYKPHITVDEEIWQQVQDEKLRPSDMHMRVGALVLKARGVVVKTWS